MSTPADIAMADSVMADSGGSLDSQQILDAYLRQYGVDAQGSCGVAVCNFLTPVHTKSAAVDHRDFAEFPSAHTPKPPDEALFETLPQLGRLSPSLVAVTTREQQPCPSHHQFSHHPLLPPNKLLPPKKANGPLPSTKMDFPDSPTQSNGSRCYEQYLQPSSRSSPIAQQPYRVEQTPQPASQATFDELRSLQDDDTGAVNFNLVTPTADYTSRSLARSPTSGDTQLVDSYPLVPRSDRHLEQPTSPLIETPAPPRNPFANSRSQLLPTSQLFQGTQPSSAVRNVSPTSSRPSPNNLFHQSISPDLVSSPVPTREFPSSAPPQTTSSPRPAPWSASSGLEDKGQRDASDGARDGTVAAGPPSSPPYGRPNSRPAPVPLETYISMQKSQEQRSANEPRPGLASQTSSSDEADSLVNRKRRERRARAKKEAASRRLSSVSFRRWSRNDDIEVPSTNTKKRRLSPSTRPQELEAERDSPARDTIEDSQGQVVIPKTSSTSHQPPASSRSSGYGSTPKAASGLPAIMPRTAKGANGSSHPHVGTDTDGSSRYAIPETSPAEKHAGDLPAPATTNPDDSANHAGLIPSSFTPVSGSPITPKAKALPVSSDGVETDQYDETSSPYPASSILGEGVAQHTRRDSSPQPAVPDQDSAPVLASSPPVLGLGSNRSSARVPPKPTTTTTPVPQPKTAAPSTLTLDTSSSLSSLGSTPSLSDSTTPATPESPSPASPRRSSGTLRRSARLSPAAAKSRRRRGRERIPSKLNITAGENSRDAGAPDGRRLSLSTDELTRSASPTTAATTVLERKSVVTRAGRTATKSPLPAAPRGLPGGRSGSRVFQGMAFAISFQFRKPGETAKQYRSRMELARSIESRIVQAGGRILSEGFDELFENPPIRSAAESPSSSSGVIGLRLKPDARPLGFTALIADDHSRKAKYMQALALGLPCLAARWVTDCLDRGELVDWASYLLCAGRSAFLNDAVRSRDLSPYDAATATLADVVERRPCLLAGSRILVVLEKSDESKKMAYIFLARALGADLARVHSPDEARARLHATPATFDWAYVDEKVNKDELLAAPAALAEDGGKGRKRKRGGAACGPPPPAALPNNIRFLDNELVIQSLILGRMINDNEEW